MSLRLIKAMVDFLTMGAGLDSSIRSGIAYKNGEVINMFGYGGIFESDLQILCLSTTGFVPSNTIGKRGTQDNYFKGILIGEILIYDRVLSANEIETVEKYLGIKTGEYPFLTIPTHPSGNPPTYQVIPANDSVTTAHLTEQILKYLKPEITTHPQANNVYADTNHTFSVTAEGKYLTYQWKKNGTDLPGETNATLTITDANATLHDGNYSVVVSNEVGSMESNFNCSCNDWLEWK